MCNKLGAGTAVSAAMLVAVPDSTISMTAFYGCPDAPSPQRLSHTEQKPQLNHVAIPGLTNSMVEPG